MRNRASRLQWSSRSRSWLARHATGWWAATRPGLQAAASAIKKAAAGLWRGLKGVAGGLYYHDCLGLASQVAYSALFSLFPFLLLLNTLVAYVPAGDRVEDWLLGSLRALVDPESRLYEIVQNNVFVEIGALSATLLSVGAILTVWSASGAVMVLLKAVNRAYGLDETRSWQKRRAMAAGWSVAGAVVVPLGVVLLIFGARIGRAIGESVGYGSVLHTLWVGLRWPVVFVVLVGVLGVFFHLAPSKRQHWYAVLPGALFTVAAVMGVSAGLSWFVSQSILQVRWLTYGAIGTVIVLLFWAFLIALMALVGVEINAAVNRAVEAHRGHSGHLVESRGDE